MKTHTFTCLVYDFYTHKTTIALRNSARDINSFDVWLCNLLLGHNHSEHPVLHRSFHLIHLGVLWQPESPKELATAPLYPVPLVSLLFNLSVPLATNLQHIRFFQLHLHLFLGQTRKVRFEDMGFCNSPACSAAHSALPSSDLCAVSGCPLETIETGDCAAFRCPNFYYAYGDGSLVAGLRSDRLSIQSTEPTTPLLHLPNFTFGCAHTALAEPVGVAGFGRGILSLPAQLAAFSPTLGNRFSYCLISHSFDTTRLRRPSPLILGRSSVQPDDQSGEFIYTPMLDNPKHPYFYSVALEAVSVAGKRLPATRDLRRIDGEGNGGMVVDSGTTFTILPAGMYGSLSKEFDLRMGRKYERATRAEEEMGMGLCYYSDDVKAHVPKLVLHFGGNASVALPARNYFLGFDREEGGQKRKVGCLMMMNGGDDSDGSGGGPSATLGNYQQQGFEVVYDLERWRVGFARRRCAQLWDTLSRG